MECKTDSYTQIIRDMKKNLLPSWSSWKIQILLYTSVRPIGPGLPKHSSFDVFWCDLSLSLRIISCRHIHHMFWRVEEN